MGTGMRLWCLALCLVASAASGQKDEAAALEAKLNAMDTAKLCVGLGSAVRDKKLAPAYAAAWERVAKKRAGALSDNFIPAIIRREPEMRMSECDLVASLGRPEKVNTTHHAAGTRRQFVFDNPRRYVYVTNGSVTAWQD